MPRNAAPRVTKSGEPDKRFKSDHMAPEMVAQQKIGRPKGAKNKMTVELKGMIEKALERQKGGGVAYLSRQAKENPVAFMGLLGKILPKQIDIGVSVLAVDLMGTMQQRRTELAQRKRERDIIDAETYELDDD